MIRAFFIFLFIWPAMLTLSGCGTLFTGNTDYVNIVSTPENAKVFINGTYMGVTPLKISLKRDRDHIIKLKKDGYEEAEAGIIREFNMVAILNTISPLCWVIDIVTGGLWSFENDEIKVELKKASGSV